MKTNLAAMKKAGFSLALFAFISVLFVSMTDRLTHKKIAENKAMMLLQALNEVVSSSAYDNDLIKSKITLSPKETGLNDETYVFFATRRGNPVVAIFEVSTQKGYNGTIKVLVGINANDLTISGVRVIQHKETPGLGDKMELSKSDWVISFNGKSLENPTPKYWLVKKDGGTFDQFTGATITPRAIVNLVKSTLFYSQNNLLDLFSQHQKKVTQ